MTPRMLRPGGTALATVIAMSRGFAAGSRDEPTSEQLLAKFDAYLDTYHDALGRLVAEERLVQEVGGRRRARVDTRLE